jgi:hypothetical protein
VIQIDGIRTHKFRFHFKVQPGLDKSNSSERFLGELMAKNITKFSLFTLTRNTKQIEGFRSLEFLEQKVLVFYWLM